MQNKTIKMNFKNISIFSLKNSPKSKLNLSKIKVSRPCCKSKMKNDFFIQKRLKKSSKKPETIHININFNKPIDFFEKVLLNKILSSKKKINLEKNFSSLNSSKKINFTSDKSSSKFSEINLNNFISNNISFNNIISSNNSTNNLTNMVINENTINQNNNNNQTQPKKYNFKTLIDKNETSNKSNKDIITKLKLRNINIRKKINKLNNYIVLKNNNATTRYNKTYKNISFLQSLKRNKTEKNIEDKNNYLYFSKQFPAKTDGCNNKKSKNFFPYTKYNFANNNSTSNNTNNNSRNSNKKNKSFNNITKNFSLLKKQKYLRNKCIFSINVNKVRNSINSFPKTKSKKLANPKNHQKYLYFNNQKKIYKQINNLRKNSRCEGVSRNLSVYKNDLVNLINQKKEQSKIISRRKLIDNKSKISKNNSLLIPQNISNRNINKGIFRKKYTMNRNNVSGMNPKDSFTKKLIQNYLKKNYSNFKDIKNDHSICTKKNLNISELLEKNSNKNNPQYIIEYFEDILINLLLEEYDFFINKKYIDPLYPKHEKCTLTPEMRTIVVDWLVFVHNQIFKFKENTLFLTVQTLDRYFSKNSDISTEKTDFVLLSIFNLISRIEETNYINSLETTQLSQNRFDPKDISNLQFEILDSLNFEVITPTICDFFEIYSVILNLNENQINQGFYIMNVILLDFHMLEYPNFILAFAVIIIISENKNKNYKKIEEDIMKIIKEKKLVKFNDLMKEDKINIIVHSIKALFEFFLECDFVNIRNKFNDKKD